VVNVCNPSTEADGTVRIAINGAAFGTFTRLSNGTVVSVNASGHTTITMRPDGVVTYVSRGLLVAINATGIWQ
jgi:hypothetical protein